MMNKTIKIGKINTSKVELVDIAKAWLAISLAFAFVYSGASLFSGGMNKIFSMGFLVMFLISLFTAGIGFLFHELAHKFVAQKYGCVAEFRAFDQMLYLAVGLAVAVGFIFAAPGAVMIHGQVTRKENGIISAAGPLTNFSLAMIFMGLISYLPAWSFIFNPGFFINLWLGLFNLIPFGNFDGIKILHWNRYVWMGMVAFGVYFLFFL
jgi:Zn-dependent protease